MDRSANVILRLLRSGIETLPGRNLDTGSDKATAAACHVHEQKRSELLGHGANLENRIAVEATIIAFGEAPERKHPGAVRVDDTDDDADAKRVIPHSVRQDLPNLGVRGKLGESGGAGECQSDEEQDDAGSQESLPGRWSPDNDPSGAARVIKGSLVSFSVRQPAVQRAVRRRIQQ